MNFLELPHAELDPQFGPRFIYQAYKTLLKFQKRPDNMVLMTRAEHQRLLKEVLDHKAIVEKVKRDAETSIKSLEADFKKLLEASSSESIPVPGPADIKTSPKTTK